MRGEPVAGCRAATPVQLTVERGGRTVHLSVYPRYNAKEKRPLIGFGFGLERKQFGVAAATAPPCRRCGAP